MSTKTPRRTTAQWAQVIEEFSAGQESERAFCDRHALRLGTFRKWRYRFGAPSATTGRVVTKPSGGFVPVAMPRGGVSPSGFTVHVGDQVHIECPPGVAIELIAQLARAVRHEH